MPAGQGDSYLFAGIPGLDFMTYGPPSSCTTTTGTCWPYMRHPDVRQLVGRYGGEDQHGPSKSSCPGEPCRQDAALPSVRSTPKMTAMKAMIGTQVQWREPRCQRHARASNPSRRPRSHCERRASAQVRGPARGAMTVVRLPGSGMATEIAMLVSDQN